MFMSPGKKWFLLDSRTEPISLFLRASLSLLIQPIDSNQNNLNLKERACEFYTPIIA